ncbi:hypothetical protein [Prochlorococcus sp. MIT 0801]|uniref:hypothetical protein n=1 Tax=Prochlorococcus sp. MIT 0801 TaxID=1501269 RepID=UPI0004F5FFEA|nr:hypothetical protein [Prochlorococcus sp. MIT 0801]AIQ97348.1 hypothetical protein EW15_1256 [Prochlorococcus sp. MIT 0801]
MSSCSSVNSQSIEERDAIELYFACVTSFSLDDEGVECTSRCVEVHLKNEN